MIYTDSHGFPVDKTGDGGDSAVRAGILALYFGTNLGYKQNAVWVSKGRYINYHNYEKKPGWFTRHPIQVPWDNMYNYTRDQAMVFCAGQAKMQQHSRVRRFFWERVKQFPFCQNFERDYPGTIKKLPKDYADPLFFNHWGALILGGRIYALYLLVPFFLLVHLFVIVLHKFSRHHEENQMIAECSLYGTLKVYKCIHSGWEKVSEKYWADRGEIEYHSMLKELINDV